MIKNAYAAKANANFGLRWEKVWVNGFAFGTGVCATWRMCLLMNACCEMGGGAIVDEKIRNGNMH